MPGPSFRSASTATLGGNTPSPPLPANPVPAGTQSGDLLLAFTVNNYTGSPPSAPSGWTNLTPVSGSTATAFPTSMFGRVATGSEPGSYQFANAEEVVIVCYQNAKTTPALVAQAIMLTVQSGYNDYPDSTAKIARCPSITPGNAGSVLVDAFFWRSSEATVAQYGYGMVFPAGWTERGRASCNVSTISVLDRMAGSTAPTGTVDASGASEGDSRGGIAVELAGRRSGLAMVV